MISENSETQIDNIFEESDEFTQTSNSSVLIQLSYLKSTGDDCNYTINTVFEQCQIIQDPEYPGSVTIVKEFVTEEVKDYPKPISGNNKASRYKYIREVIYPDFKPKSNTTESCEVLVREALKSARNDFPDFYPSLEVYHLQKSLKRAEERDIGESSLISKVDAQTSYLSMDSGSDPDKVCLSDCSQAEDPKKCKQACKELNEERKSAPPRSPPDKPPCGKPVHRPPACEKPPNCKPKIKRKCSPKSSSSDCDKIEDEILISDLDTKESENKNPNEVIVTGSSKYSDSIKESNDVACISPDSNSYTVLAEKIDDTLSKNSDDLNKPTDSNINSDCDSNYYKNLGLNEIKDTTKEDNKVDLGNIVPNIIFEPDSTRSFIEAHNKAIATIKLAMEDCIGIVYDTSKDTVLLLATESAKTLAKMKATEAMNADSGKNIDNKTSKSFTSINFFTSKEKDPKEENNPPGPAAIVIEKAIKTANSAIDILSKQISSSLENFPKNLSSFTEKSSPYDEPQPKKEEKPVQAFTASKEEKPTHAVTPDATNGVFSALKNKIYSIFSDSGSKKNPSLSKTSSSSFSSRSDDE